MELFILQLQAFLISLVAVAGIREILQLNSRIYGGLLLGLTSFLIGNFIYLLTII